MSVIEQDIRSIPAILRQTSARIDERRGVVAPLLDGPMVFLGCGSSYCVAMAAAALYEHAQTLGGDLVALAEESWTSHREAEETVPCDPNCARPW